jgi:16S rRNA (cytosine(967)-C(5))-methyltransferase
MSTPPSDGSLKLQQMVRRSTELLRLLVKSSGASDSLTSEFLHSKKHLTRSERRFISGLAHAVLRAKSLVEYCAPDTIAEGACLLDKEQIRMLLPYSVMILGSMANVFNCVEQFGSLFEREENVSSEEIDAVLGSALSGSLSCPAATAEEILFGVRARFRHIDAEVQAMLATAQVNEPSISSLLAVRYSIPEWMIRTWQQAENSSWTLVANLANACMMSAPVDLRVNLRHISRTSALSALAAYGMEAEPTPLSPAGIRLRSRTRITDTELFQGGFIEIQDEASQLVAYALSPTPEWQMLDACSGAGGKALHVADLQQDHGCVIACDVERSRLRAQSARAHRSEVRSIRTVHVSNRATANDLEVLLGKYRGFDAVIVDAPCSGTGTMRRNPAVKWRTKEQHVGKYVRKQRELLELYSRFVRRGGVLVYSTCSLLPQENSEVVHSFLTGHPNFSGDALGSLFTQHGIRVPYLEHDAWQLSLNPARSETDGFFIARMKRD